jgi:hypothetical protein
MPTLCADLIDRFSASGWSRMEHRQVTGTSALGKDVQRQREGSLQDRISCFPALK